MHPHLEFQRVRHGATARLVRHMAYRCVVGREGWPPTFETVRDRASLPALGSPHLYLHLPFCASRCPHCPYITTLHDPARHRAYGDALRRELEAYVSRSDVPPVRSLYVGGGTPSLTPDLVELGIKTLRPLFAPQPEVGVEVHPRDGTALLFDRLRRAGVTRVSLGVETLQPDLLRLLGRGYAPQEALEAIRSARSAGFECVDVNLIFAIPGQDVDAPARDADRCLTLGVDQISAYPLFTFPHTALGRRIAEGRLRSVGDRSRLRSQRAIARVCRRHGLRRTSVWSFTRPGVAPYSTVTHEDYVGFGVGAGTKVAGEFRFNPFSLDAYLAAPTAGPALRLQAGPRFQRAHWLYWQLYRTEVDPGRYRATFERDLDRDAGRLLQGLRLVGLARHDGDGLWRLTESGAIWVHRLQALFSLAYIDELWGAAQAHPLPDRIVLR